MDSSPIRDTCRQLQSRLLGNPNSDVLRAVYLEMAPLAGRLQAALGATLRAHPNSPEAVEAQAALDRFKREMRQVGLDLRLGSPPALQIGLQTALQSALETIDSLERAER